MNRNNDNRIVITGTGMVTPVGLSVQSGCAALRAGISMMNELATHRVEGDLITEPVVGSRVPLEWFDGEPETEEWPGHDRFKLPEPFPKESYVASGIARINELALPAFFEILSQLDFEKEPQDKTGLYIGFNEHEADVDKTVTLLQVETGIEFDPGLAFTEGRAAALMALDTAIKDINEGSINGAFVGGIDSLIRTPILERLDHEGILRSASRPQGVIPGEAGAFIYIEKMKTAVKKNRKPVATILATDCGEEPTTGSDKPNRAIGLTRVLHSVRKESGLADPPLVVCDLNGDRYRAIEWSLAETRALGHLHGDSTTLHPADCIGDTGAASSMVNIIWATEAFRKEYAGSDQSLIWGASDNNKRAAAIIASNQQIKAEV